MNQWDRSIDGIKYISHFLHWKKTKLSVIYSPFSTWRFSNRNFLTKCSYPYELVDYSPTAPISSRLLTGSTVAPHPRRAKGTAAWPLWRTCCTRYGRSRPSSQWRRKLSCPTCQSWTPQCWVGSPVLSRASLLCLCTSSPNSSSYTCWVETKRNR